MTEMAESAEVQGSSLLGSSQTREPPSRTFRLRAILLAIGLVALALLTVVGVRLARGNSQGGEVKLNPYAAPPFALNLFNGDQFRLDQARGQIVVLNFWASWCVPCKTEMPVLEGTYQHYRGQGVQMVGVDIKDTPEDAAAFFSATQQAIRMASTTRRESTSTTGSMACRRHFSSIAAAESSTT